ncbi:MAG: cytochrome-c oxidase, cbb3-type subunit III, partial [Betaproteobacteria bacterium]|nr:cytochrome-c oxidase, cbb3-type subunit III [Betaproteobacteria bacterium]
TTGHTWDEDLQEMNNPLPRWWVWLFVITIVFSVGYLVAYPGLGTFKGLLGWTQTGQYEQELRVAEEAERPLYARFTRQSVEQLESDPQAMAVGERLFMNNCAQCHGSDARGSKGFPNLTDSDWLFGGSPEQVSQTITEGRVGQMPPMAAAVGSADDVRNVANYVLSLSGSPHNDLAAQMGKAKFVVCAACHGPDGKGNTAIGAPNLTDNIWLFGWGEQAVIDMVEHGRTSVMPAWKDKLTPEQIHVLTAYVLHFSSPTAAKTGN